MKKTVDEMFSEVIQSYIESDKRLMSTINSLRAEVANLKNDGKFLGDGKMTRQKNLKMEENERSKLLVRAQVAEETVAQLEAHLRRI